MKDRLKHTSLVLKDWNLARKALRRPTPYRYVDREGRLLSRSAIRNLRKVRSRFQGRWLTPRVW